MTYSQALDYIHSNFWQGSKPGLSRTEELLGKLGNPQESLSFIHVAGTNGKGSFCAMLSSVLQAAGYRVGLYTSPYILDFTERMRVDGRNIARGELAEITEYIRPFAEAMSDRPTEFELITAVAMEYFKRRKCDIVVLECGMGGRLDSTNVIRTALLSVITGVSLDHTAFLGNTVREIAAEKAGIIKPRVPCLFCGEDAQALAVIQSRAENVGAPLFTVKRDGIALRQISLDGARFDAMGYADLFLPLLGVYQPQNALRVLTAIGILKTLGVAISETAVREGLGRVRWRARYEKLSHAPLILFDGGHNPEGVKAAVESTRAYFGEEKLSLVVGMMADKDHRNMVGQLSRIAQRAFCAAPENPRALPASALAEEFTACGVEAVACSSVSDAVFGAVEQGKAVLCVGSLYMYAEVIDALKSKGIYPLSQET